MRFGTVVIDPPWPYQRTSKKGRDGQLTGYSDQHYEPMSERELCELPVGDVLGVDVCRDGRTRSTGVLLMWTTGPMLPAAVRLVEAWGLEWVTVAYWHKTYAALDTPDLFGGINYRPALGVGYWFRGDTEPVVIAKKPGGWSYRTGERATFVGERTGHSRKPPWLHEVAEKHFPGPYLEIFARHQRPGWTCLGDGIDGMDITESLTAVLA